MTRVVLLGDSHLARVRRDLERLRPPGGTVVNCAVGGAVASDLLPQAASASLSGADRVVVSVGTNDAAPWRQVSLDRAVGQAGDFVTAYADVVDRLVFLSTPGVDETQTVGRTNAELARCASVFARRFTDAGGRVLDGARLLAPLGSAAFADDGVHLSGAGYDVLLPALREALSC